MLPAGTQTCGLCGKPGEIQNSHLLPAWCYRRIIEDCDDSQPVQVTKNSAVLSNEQVRQRLLCAGCEDYFGKIEDKVERLTRRRNGKQLIFQRLTHIGGRTGQLYELAEESASILSHFATSVIWRAHAMGKGCELGPYGDQFRRYLLGQSAFPADASFALMVIEPTELGIDPKSWLTNPATARTDRFRIHGFIACGLVFRLFVGKQIPTMIRKGCLASTAGPRYIHVRPWNECQDVMGALRLLEQTTPRGKLAQFPGG
jgi:hypothetical protein